MYKKSASEKSSLKTLQLNVSPTSNAIIPILEIFFLNPSSLIVHPGLTGQKIAIRPQPANFSGVRAEVLKETLGTSRAPGTAELSPEPDQQYVDVLVPAQRSRVLKGQADLVVPGSRSDDIQALGDAGDVPVHRDDLLPSVEEEEDVGGLRSHPWQGHERLPRLGVGQVKYRRYLSPVSVQDGLSHGLQRPAPLIVHPGWPNSV